MDHQMGMGMGETVGHVPHEGHDPPLVEIRRRRDVEGLALDVLHDEGLSAIPDVAVEKGDHVGMLDLLEDLDLPAKPGPPLEIVRSRAETHRLDGHPAVELDLAGGEDDSHAALAEDPLHGIATPKLFGPAVDDAANHTFRHLKHGTSQPFHARIPPPPSR